MADVKATGKMTNFTDIYEVDDKDIKREVEKYGVKLYRHLIHFTNPAHGMDVTIISTKPTAFTKEDIYYATHGVNGFSYLISNDGDYIYFSYVYGGDEVSFKLSYKRVVLNYPTDSIKCYEYSKATINLETGEVEEHQGTNCFTANKYTDTITELKLL